MAWSGEVDVALFPRIRELGYDGVELPLLTPEVVDPDRVKRALADAGLAATWSRQPGLGERERAAVQDLAYGTLRFLGRLEALLEELIDRPLRDARLRALLLTALSVARELVLEGDEVYVDALVIKFEDTSVMGGDALKGKALLLFRRIFTDRRRPAEGEVLDREGQMPQSYAAERAPTAFERDLWARFWELANDPEEAKKRGVRALHGEAVSTRLRKDRIYTITLRSTGELTIQPVR